jgi:exonuclease VII small subunit
MSDRRPAFAVGEILQWRSRLRPDGQVTIRPVSFVEWRNHLAVIRFGLKSDGTGEPNLFSVSSSELTRPPPPQALKVEPPPPPAPVISLEDRRQTLSDAFARYQEAEQAVASAQELLDRALFRVEKADRELRNYADMETHAVAAVIHEIQMNGNGQSISDDDEQWRARGRAERDSRAAQSAYDQLAKQLTDAKVIAAERQHTLHQSAAHVLAGLVEREANRLSILEMQTAELRVELQAAQLLWFAGQPIPIAQAQAQILNTPPPEVREGVGERMRNTESRQEVFATLFARLVGGDIAADLETCRG